MTHLVCSKCLSYIILDLFTAFQQDSRFRHPLSADAPRGVGGTQLAGWGWGLREMPKCCRQGGASQRPCPRAVSHTYQIHRLPFLHDFHVIIIISFRLTFLRREQRCFPKVWTASYLPLQTWFTGNAGLPFGSFVPFAFLPNQPLWDVGEVVAAEGAMGLPSTT